MPRPIIWPILRRREDILVVDYVGWVYGRKMVRRM
jgi:hypothetical protein